MKQGTAACEKGRKGDPQTGQAENSENKPNFPETPENPEQEKPSQENSSDPLIEKKPFFLPLFAVNFIGSLGFSIVLPFLVFLVERFGSNAFIYGLASSMYPAFQLIGAPILGKWSDIYGRKKILLLSQLGTLFSWIIFLGALFLPGIPLFKVDSEILGNFIFTLPLAVLFFARALDGLTGGNISVANAYLADITSEKDRSRNFGKMVISENLGFIVGPALAGILSLTEFGFTVPVLGAAIISLTGTLLIILYIPEDKKRFFKTPADNSRKIFGYEIKKCEITGKTEKFNFKEILRLPNIPYMLSLYFLIDLGYNIFYTSFPMHAIKGLDWSIAEMGFYFTALSALIITVQSTVLPIASKK